MHNDGFVSSSSLHLQNLFQKFYHSSVVGAFSIRSPVQHVKLCNLKAFASLQLKPYRVVMLDTRVVIAEYEHAV